MPSTSEIATSEHDLYDVLIVGGSHAGLSAALTLYRALHQCVIFDSSAPRNSSGTKLHLTSGWDGSNPEKLKEAQRSELEATGIIDFVSRAVASAKKLPDGTFEVTDESNVVWKGRRMILAIGMHDVYPGIEGYAENYGTRIFNCMFCFGYEQRGSPSAGLLASGILANPMHAIINTKDALKFVDHVTIYTDGNEELKEQLGDKLTEGMSIDSREVASIHAGQEQTDVYLDFEDGSSQGLAFLVHKPDMTLTSSLVEDLGLETVPGIGIKVSPPFNQTSVEGVFAAGDCCSPVRTIPNALSMGSSAGCGLARQLPKSTWRKASKAHANGLNGGIVS